MTAIPVTNSGGIAATGLTIGTVYSLWTEGGPWHPHGLSTGDDSYTFHLSDNGSTWSSGIGTSFDPLAPASDTYRPAWCSARRNLDSVHVQLTFTATATSVYIRVADNVFGDNTGALAFQVAAGTLPFCQYGTAVQGGTQAGVIVTTALIDLLLIAVNAPLGLAVIFDAFVGKTLFTGDMCNGLPPLTPQFTNDDFVGSTGLPNPASLGKWWQGLQAIAWPQFCECNAGPIGSPPPIAVPLPTVILPPAAPTAPISINCDGNDLCTLMNTLMRQLAGMSQSIAQLRSDVTLIQRQHVPFAYVPGTLHSGLSGSGTITVSGILGLSINITAQPGYMSSDMAPVPSTYKFGTISLGTADGWMRRSVVTHDPHLILNIDADVTAVGYLFTNGVVADVQELVREP